VPGLSTTLPSGPLELCDFFTNFAAGRDYATLSPLSVPIARAFLFGGQTPSDGSDVFFSVMLENSAAAIDQVAKWLEQASNDPTSVAVALSAHAAGLSAAGGLTEASFQDTPFAVSAAHVRALRKYIITWLEEVCIAIHKSKVCFRGAQLLSAAAILITRSTYHVCILFLGVRTAGCRNLFGRRKYGSGGPSHGV